MIFMVAFLLFAILRLYSVRAIGYAWIRRQYGLSAVAFAVLFLLLAGLALIFFSGCASEPPKKPELPAPEGASAESTLKYDLPPEFAARAAIPPRVEGKISFAFESKATQADPIRSHFDGKITLVLTDPLKTRQYLDFAATLSGDYDGPPREGWSRAATQAADLVGVFYKGLQESGAEPKAH
jgi:hypothetical protein